MKIIHRGNKIEEERKEAERWAGRVVHEMCGSELEVCFSDLINGSFYESFASAPGCLSPLVLVGCPVCKGLANVYPPEPVFRLARDRSR